MTFGSLFAGIGGIDLGLERSGMTCKWQVEIDPHARRVLAKHWPDVRRHDDIRTFPPDGYGWNVDLIAGGFPCQDVSLAGRGSGLDGQRSGLWFEYVRIIRELRPRFVLVENVSALLIRGMDRVLGTLSELGFNAEWSTVSACAMGAPHMRDRVFIVAYRDQIGRGGSRLGFQQQHAISQKFNHWKTPSFGQGWKDVERWFESLVPTCDGLSDATNGPGVDDGIPERLDRIARLGNSVVPQIAQFIGERIMEYWRVDIERSR